MPIFHLLAGGALARAFEYFPFLSSLALLCLALSCLLRKKYILVLLLALGMAYPFIRDTRAETPRRGGGPVLLKGAFISPALYLGSVVSQVFSVPGEGQMAVYSDREFDPGRQYSLKVMRVTPKRRQNPGERQREPYGVLLGVLGEGDKEGGLSMLTARARAGLNRSIRDTYTPDAASLVMAVTTGQREMGRGLKEDFQRAGLSHLLSISGTHFGLFSVMLFGLFRAAIRRLPVRALERVALYLSPSQAAAVLTFPFMLIYLGVSGAGIPSMRSFVMVGLVLSGLLLCRRASWMNFLFVAASALFLWDPAVFSSLSFQLSFLAVLFILGGPGGLVAAKDDAASGPAERGLLWYLRKSALITALASLGVYPLVAYRFHYISLVSPLANMVVTPLVCFLIVPLSLFDALVFALAGGHPAAPVIEALSGAAIHLVRGSASLPMASVRAAEFPPVLLATYYLGFVGYYFTKRRALVALALVPFAAYALYAYSSDRPLRVSFLDAGRADAILVELPDGKSIAIDSGWGGRDLADHLELRGIGALDALVLTHGHPDHAGGAGLLIERLVVKEVWDNAGMSYPEGFLGGVPRRGLYRGDVVSGEGYSIRVLHPAPGFYSVSDFDRAWENDMSLVMRLEGRRASFLFASDVGREAAEDIARLGPALRSDVLKVPHHGLASGYHRGFLEQISPWSAVVTGTDLNEASASVLGEAAVYATGKDGAVLFEETGRGIEVKTYGDYAISRAGGLAGELRNLRRLFSVW